VADDRSVGQSNPGGELGASGEELLDVVLQHDRVPVGVINGARELGACRHCAGDRDRITD
jgi:hypothetical protein